MLLFLGENHRLPLFHMAEHFIWLNEKKKLINEFTIGYIINPGLNVNKNFREQVEKYMLTTFSSIKKPFIKATLENINTSVLALILFYRTRSETIAYRVLGCVI